MQLTMRGPVTITSSAPTRICDNGGWTDTWFAGHGCVFNIAISPRVEVTLTAFDIDGGRPRVVIDARCFGDRYAPTGIDRGEWGRHPLLEASIAEVGLPDGVAVEVVIESDAPYGASMGTSAATCVALVGALEHLAGRTPGPQAVARTAWRVETELLGQQCGIQDQLASAHGGINVIRMHEYPDATVDQVAIPTDVLDELERRLVLVYLGVPHSSSAIHEAVIADLEALGPNGQAIDALRQTAEPSARAVIAGDFTQFGRIMIANTEAQRALHPELVCAAADAVISIAADHGALGHKINGAGGTGGSVTLLADGSAERRQALVEAIEQSDPTLSVVPISLSADGLLVTGPR